MYNGTFSPALTTLDTVSGHFDNLQAQGWSTINNISFGGIGVWNQSVFVTDMRTFGDGGTGGIVRFDMTTGLSSRLASPQGSEYSDLTIGLDGLLYGYSSAGIDVYDPASGTFLRTVSSLTGDIRGIAVDRSGTIYAADWSGVVRRLDAWGEQQGTALQTGASLNDIDINEDGVIVLGSRFGRVFLTDSGLQSFTSFDVGGEFGPNVHVAFATAVPEASTLMMLLAGLGIAGWHLRSQRAARVPTRRSNVAGQLAG